MMKKILAVFLMLICCISLFGCGLSPKEEAEKFHEKYFKQEYSNKFLEEVHVALNKAYEQYGQTRDADKAFVSSFPYSEKLNTIIDKATNEKIENKEIFPLKDCFTNLLTETNKLYDALGSNDKSNYNNRLKAFNKAAFNYNNEYSKITTGKGIPVMNTNIGQLYAYVASDVAFAITDINTPWLRVQHLEKNPLFCDVFGIMIDQDNLAIGVLQVQKEVNDVVSNMDGIVEDVVSDGKLSNMWLIDEMKGAAVALLNIFGRFSGRKKETACAGTQTVSRMF